MTTLPKFYLDLTNSYRADSLAELIETYNQHLHSQTIVANFKAYPINVGDSVGFLALGNQSLDVFASINNQPLQIVSINDRQLKLNRIADVSTTGSLVVFQVNSAYSYIIGVRSQANSDTIEFDSSFDRSGFISGDLLEAALTKTYQRRDRIQSGSILTPPNLYPEVEYTVSFSNGAFSISLPSSQPQNNNPTLNLVRGRTYVFRFDPSALQAGKFHLVTRLSDPLLGLDKYRRQVDLLSDRTRFTVPYDCPPLLYYICQANGNIYGTIEISGSAPNPSVTLQQAWTAIDPLVPQDLENELLYVCLGETSNYRCTDWKIYPLWENPQADRSAYIQLQYLTASGTRAPLSGLFHLNNVGLARPNLLTTIVPSNTILVTAVYSPYNLKELVQDISILNIL